MYQTGFIFRTRGYRFALFAILTSILLVGCDAVQLCGEYACVSYRNECERNGTCASTPRQCEAAGSIRDRAPRIVNQLRAARRSCGGASGLGSTSAAINELIWDNKLASVSASHARDMARNHFESFIGTDGLSTAERVSLAGIESTTVFESITTGPQTSAEAINFWLDINTDCEQLLATEVTRIGMACAVSELNDTGPYWSLLLVSPER